MLFSASQLHLDYGNGAVLECESLDAKEGEKIGLVGANGCGKSTLLKVLHGIESAQGTIIRSGGMKSHLLSQSPVFSEPTIWQQMIRQNDGLKEPREDYELKAILTRLHLDDFDRPIDELSGGQKRRLSLALALADRADLLLLDEPTNHLDIEMIEWLENWLAKSKQTVITVTHDRFFLEKACTRILELDHGKLYSHPGSFESYLEARQIREALAQAQRQKRENLYRKELEWVRAGVQARSTKSKSRLDRFEALRRERIPLQQQAMELQFPAERLGKKTIEWKNVAFGYPNRENLFSDFSYQCQRTDRIALIGPNGSGKSTFLNLLAQKIQPLEGAFEFGPTVRIGYFEQTVPLKNPSIRVLEYIEETARAVQTADGLVSASAMLERFLFDKNKQYLPLSRLSGGELRRLYLVRTLMQAPNVLLLDEPGNDLDLMTMEILEDYLDSFPGIVIFVSHDRYFIDRTATVLFELKDGKWHKYQGGYSEQQALREQERHTGSKQSAASSRSGRTRRPSLSSREKKELEDLLSRLEILQSERDRLNDQLGQETEYRILSQIEKERDAVLEEIEEAEMRWLELEEKKETLAAG